jgi:hypothetical protein
MLADFNKNKPYMQGGKLRKWPYWQNKINVI